MRPSRTTRRIAALAAVFGIALQALWPFVAQARPRDAISVPVCSAEGSHRSIDLPIGNPNAGKGAEHCKHCLLGDGQSVLAPGIPAALSPSRESQQVPGTASPFAEQSRHLAARPRAPPQSS
jgi:hypothetical protein